MYCSRVPLLQGTIDETYKLYHSCKSDSSFSQNFESFRVLMDYLADFLAY